MTRARTFEQMRSLVWRAEYRWQRRQRQHGSWIELPVLEAMVLVKGLHHKWQTGEAYR